MARPRQRQQQPPASAHQLQDRIVAAPRQLAVKVDLVGYFAVVGVVVAREGVELAHGRPPASTNRPIPPSTSSPSTPSATMVGLSTGSKRGACGGLAGPPAVGMVKLRGAGGGIGGRCGALA